MTNPLIYKRTRKRRRNTPPKGRGLAAPLPGAEVEVQAVEIGAEIVDGKHRYRCIAHRPHVRLDGSKTTLAIMVGSCATCGQDFETSIPLRCAKPGLNRRCAEHKRPGIRSVRSEAPHAFR